MAKWVRRGVCLAAFAFLLAFSASLLRVRAQEKRIEFFYENVCASCEGDADFFLLLDSCLTEKEREALADEVVSYNIFMDSCREYYRERAEALEIPPGTSMPVLIADGRWVSGYDGMEELLKAAAKGSGDGLRPDGNASDALEADGDDNLRREQENTDTRTASEGYDTEAFLERLGRELAEDREAALLFTTQACEDCDRAKEWLARQQEQNGKTILEYNIISEPCVDFLKSMFREYGVEEQNQKVPVLFYGEKAAVGAGEICKLEADQIWSEEGKEQLQEYVERAGEGVKTAQSKEGDASYGLLTLAGAGLLAGFNPCSISMLLMLLSIFVAEKASVWKNGLLYLGGKYIAYFSLGLVIYTSAAGLDAHLLEGVQRILDVILAALFFAAGALYLVDAMRIRRQEYGKIRTQLPVGMRRWNHGLIRRASAYKGVWKPLLILGLGMAISVGEFFCTGQIYMASISYLLKSRASGVWLYLLIYTTAMSIPAFLMLLLIQRTRNTDIVSDFMLRHMGAVKMVSALLFLGFAVWFLF